MSWCLNTARRLTSLPVMGMRLGMGRRGLYVRQLPPPPDAQLPEVEPVEVDWRHVERLLPRETVPVPAAKSRYPSGWTPQQGSSELTYSVRRSVNHMLPVYLKIKENGVKRITMVRNVRGDVWLFHNELKRHLEAVNEKFIASQVNEMAQYVQFKGEYVTQVKQWMRERGL
ncbi:probable 39S ribosomal protein L49, mitochondrial [Pollicipes pollicipes]|uniref:probable 39S ribosomal protein L49, mitochondrial n=1 Tax=Pollicipes pollicipes TaxID=41117 RepID=UPI0018856133|nr:probable 39S ribosomal protein L49, mitochondrial [Pollicipes pollicipes]XP_037074849.1 probable 39S ribosomal protein L49, mitochondrial [Pollicipes pollicipes]XP_037074877.1 probable 39S ribosomal protein L49, mitochondrial [Pollicipes pollicipes]XP_037074954.1 probable 39S ribosomal protein L49, mitochondrial [Pollicipes pollicipes]